MSAPNDLTPLAYPPADRERLTALMAGCRFTPTKRHVEPHEYLVSSDPGNLAPWLTMRDAIARWGYVEPYYGHPFRYLDLSDGFTYWTMAKWTRAVTVEFTAGDPATVGYVLNRQLTTTRKAHL